MPKPVRSEIGTDFVIFDVDGQDGAWEVRYGKIGLFAKAADLDELADATDDAVRARWPALEDLDVPGMLYWARSLDANGFHRAPRV